MFGYHRKPIISTREALEKLLKSKREIPMPNYNRPPRPGTNPIPQSQNGRPKAPWEKDTSRLDEIFKEAYEMGKNRVIDTEGNIHERIRVVIETECTDNFDTYTWNTIAEINQMLNSNMGFINIGDIIVKRESVVGVYKIEEQSKENKS